LRVEHVDDQAAVVPVVEAEGVPAFRKLVEVDGHDVGGHKIERPFYFKERADAPGDEDLAAPGPERAEPPFDPLFVQRAHAVVSLFPLNGVRCEIKRFRSV
jgi:hypothetical protein